jgi:hypothetical protein
MVKKLCFVFCMNCIGFFKLILTLFYATLLYVNVRTYDKVDDLVSSHGHDAAARVKMGWVGSVGRFTILDSDF